MRATRCTCRRSSAAQGSRSAGATLRSALRVCVAREFTILADRTSPVATWLRARNGGGSGPLP